MIITLVIETADSSVRLSRLIGPLTERADRESGRPWVPALLTEFALLGRRTTQISGLYEVDCAWTLEGIIRSAEWVTHLGRLTATH